MHTSIPPVQYNYTNFSYTYTINHIIINFQFSNSYTAIPICYS